MTDTSANTEVSAPAPRAAAPATKAKATSQEVDLCTIPWKCEFAMLNEFQAAAVLGLGVKVLRRRRADGGGPRFTKLNGCSVRYKLGDLQSWIAEQPAGGGAATTDRARRGPGRPRKVA